MNMTITYCVTKYMHNLYFRVLYSKYVCNALLATREIKLHILLETVIHNKCIFYVIYTQKCVYIYHVGDDLKYNMSYSLAYCNKSRYTGFIYHFHIEFPSKMVLYKCMQQVLSGINLSLMCKSYIFSIEVSQLTL